MTSPSLVALTVFVLWALLLISLMEILRSKLVLQGRVVANEFKPDNSNLSPFMQRLARAHANCIENIPVLGSLLLIAIISNREHVTDPLAYVLVGARVTQTIIHLYSASSLAASLRFTAFLVQLVIGLHWAFELLMTR